MTQPQLERFETSDGFTIIGCRHTPGPRTPTRAVAIIAPAMGVKQDFYFPFARWLATQGLIVYTFDYRGSGRSMPTHGLKDFEARIDDWARLDAAAMIDDASWNHAGLPILWIGHSLGAQILGLVPNAGRVSGMLAIASGSGYWRLNAKPLRYYVPVLWHLAMPIATELAGYFPGKRLGMVGDLPRGVALQWRSWCLHRDYVGSEGEAIRRRFASLAIPITALAMNDDEMMTLEGTRRLMGLYTNAAVEVRPIAPRDHQLRRIGHFGFFRDKMRDALWPMVARWIDDTLDPRSLQSVA